MPRQSIFNMSLNKIYPALVQKAERKNRTKAEVNQIICWLTGYSQSELDAQLAKDITYQTFFEEAPQIALSSPVWFVASALRTLKTR